VELLQINGGAPLSSSIYLEEINGGVLHLPTVQHCLSAVRRLLFFMDFILVTLNVNDGD